MSAKRILALDTATGPCSVAVWDHGRISAYIENSKPVMQSASLMPMVEEALSASGLAYGDLTSVACTVGPGSFTGIRVGLASAKAIAYAANIPAHGFTTLNVLAFAARGAERDILAILNAGKGEWYYQLFSPSPEARHEPRLAALHSITGDIPAAVVAGNAPLDGEGFTASGVTFPRADALAALAAHSENALTLKPFYIRAPDAKLPQKAL